MQISIAVLLHVQKGWVRCLIQAAAAVMPPLTASFREYMIQWNSFADLAKCKPRECFWSRISKISKTSLNKRSTELAVCCLWASSMSALFRPSTRDASCELVIQKAKSGWKKWKQMEKHVCRNASFSRKNSLALNQLSLFLPVSICYFRSSPLDLEPWDHYCRNTGM